MVYLASNAPKEDAKLTAGYNLHQWDRFRYITKDEANLLKKEHPSWTWKDVPYDEKERIRERVNVLLQAEKVPPVGEDVMRWRMNLCVRDSGKKSHNKPRKAIAGEDFEQFACRHLPIAEAPPSKDEEAVTVVTGDHASNDTQQRKSRPYDPIRDL